TERTEAMAEVLQRSRRELEEALVAAEEARNTAVEASRVKSEFVATMSHELRTPLNAIGGYSQLLAMGIHGPVSQEQKETLARIDKSQRHLLALINDILNLARLDAGKVTYDIRRVDVAEIMRDIAPMVEPQLAAKRIHHSVDIPPGVCVRADREKLQQIVLNILSNAIKFTGEGGSIDVETGTQSGNDEIVGISIRDTGRGIPAAKTDSIFEPFMQVDASHSRVEQGAGLGLAISRDLARGMDGDITVTSTVGVGSTFTISLIAAD
ncbi:MAG: HAMP domain-containing histidine kinase, partial [Gemmatimonadaceae bacterium]|nr:HAMP domain-containing histidine kinase [Gemmatimonadaceae bacterium]